MNKPDFSRPCDRFLPHLAEGGRSCSRIVDTSYNAERFVEHQACLQFIDMPETMHWRFDLDEEFALGYLADARRKAIADSKLTHYRIGKEIGISPDQIDRFMTGRDIRISSAEKLAGYFQMRFTKPKKPKRPIE